MLLRLLLLRFFYHGFHRFDWHFFVTLFGVFGLLRRFLLRSYQTFIGYLEVLDDIGFRSGFGWLWRFLSILLGNHHIVVFPEVRVYFLERGLVLDALVACVMQKRVLLHLGDDHGLPG